MSGTVFEALMLIFFGASWPTAIIKTVRVKNPLGKSRLFLLMVFLGYLCGCAHKIINGADWVLALYIINSLMVLTDLAFVNYYKRKNEKAVQ